MAGKIPQNFIDDLVARTDLVEVVGARLDLKKAGKNYTCCCPFHTEKTPSFSVSPDRQLYYCFGCGAGGNVISFLMEYERLSFLEVIEDLASALGMSIPEQVNLQAQPQNTQLYSILDDAAKFYQAQLRTRGVGEQAVEYLKKRGLTGQLAKDYGIGYAVDGWRNLPVFIDEKQMQDAGLLIQKETGRVYDRFRHRIIFPIRDRRGRTIGFGGRVLDDSKPKYLNSPETAVFHKGREVYGLYELLKSVGNTGRILLVEGYMDVLSLAQAGITNAVACLGTSASTDHFSLLFRYASELVLCFDGDQAGRKAAWRAVENVLPELKDGRQVRIMLLPDGLDPDDLVRRGGVDRFQSQAAGAMPLSDYFYRFLAEGLDMSELEARSKLHERAKPLLSKLPVGVFKEMMFAKLAETTGVASNNAHPSSSAREKMRGNATSSFLVKKSRENLKLTPVRVAIILLMLNPSLAEELPSVIDSSVSEVEDPGVDMLFRIYKLIQQNPLVTPGGLLEFFRDDAAGEFIRKLLSWELLIPQSGVKGEFIGALERLKNEFRQKRLDVLVEKASTATGVSADEQAELLALLKGR